MNPIYIFDLDGTLALIEHRLHFVQQEPKDWPAFFDACQEDKPNVPVIALLQQLRRAGCEIRVWSGRSDVVRKATEEWLRQHEVLTEMEVSYDELVMNSVLGREAPRFLRMRPEGDHQPDELLKRKWLALLSPEDRARLGGIFDDRDRVVKMWRAAGIPCFQVAPGDF